MANAVLTTKVDPTYDDLPESRYHFPRTYLNQMQEALGQLVVYYEPRRATGALNSSGGRQAYFAVARINGIEPDPKLPDHFYARIGDYLDFDRPVPFKVGDIYFESLLQRDDGKTNKGAFGRAVRNLPTSEFDAIISAGFTRDDDFVPLEAGHEGIEAPSFGFAEEPQPTFDRPIIERVVAKPFRERAFSRHIRSAYANTCAITGLRLINGGGRPEVQAAHIRPVSEKGPDSIRNGLALSGTAHWMFDRGLVSVSDDFTILVTSKSLPDDATRLIVADRKLRVPSMPNLQPHRQFLNWHRNNKFKG